MSGDAVSQSKGAILVVDDDTESLKLLTAMLTEEGYRVRPADGGKLALASAAVEPPELILLDMRLPDIDGREVFRRLKAREATRDVPIMFISGSADAEEQLEGLTLGAVDFVVKPFRRAELLARVSTHLELGRLRRQLEFQVAQRSEELQRTINTLLFEVAERKRTESALRESEERFRIMADTSSVMIWVSGPDKLCTFFNKVWLSFTGRTMEQELANGWAEGVHRDDLDRCLAIYGSSFDARVPFEIEYRLRRADGEYRWVLDKGVPRFEEDGTFAGYVGSCVDITDFKRSQEEALARQKWESLGVMASGIAHDFTNLLSGILAESTMLLPDLPTGSPIREGVESIRTIAVRATEIVRELMIYAGDEGTDFELVDLSRLVGEIIQLLRLAISKRAKLELDLPENLPAIRANASQVRRAVMNLITNASEALGEDEGVISVRVSHVRYDPGSTDISPESPRSDCLRLEVRDTGCGISEQTQARIFDPFFTTKVSGRGLGLFAVRGIVRNHGGSLRVTSSLGRGSRFEILLPCATEPASSSAEHLYQTADDEVRTILIIEDEDTLRLAIREMLHTRGFSVMEARDGRLGLDLFREHSKEIDLVLLDLTLPDISGQEILQELRRMRPDLKVILMTGYGRGQALDIVGGHQQWGFIRKPFQFNELLDLIVRRKQSGA
jgi:PAS domain S-box-containing protein